MQTRIADQQIQRNVRTNVVASFGKTREEDEVRTSLRNNVPSARKIPVDMNVEHWQKPTTIALPEIDDPSNTSRTTHTTRQHRIIVVDHTTPHQKPKENVTRHGIAHHTKSPGEEQGSENRRSHASTEYICTLSGRGSKNAYCRLISCGGIRSSDIGHGNGNRTVANVVVRLLL